MFSIDLNCDMGEGFGPYRMGNDEELLDVVTSANIACGFHAGDPHTMYETVQMAVKKGIHIGAHPGFPDLSGFGRRKMELTPKEVYEILIYQMGALDGFVKAVGGHLHHVKPHGALYNMAAKDNELAHSIVNAIINFNPKLTLYAPYGSELQKAANQSGLPFASEVFADRTYQPDGSLTPRNQLNALIVDESLAISQALMMIKESKVVTADGSTIPVKVETICVHGDNKRALSLAKRLRETLEEEGIILKAK